MGSYTTTADHAKQIRQALKKNHGWTGRQVSVRTHLYSMGSSIYVTIKDASVDPEAVKAIAEPHAHVSRCEFTGDILNGGNMYVTVSLSREVREKLSAKHLEAVQAAIDELESCGRSTAIIPVKGTDSGVSKSGNGHGYQSWHGEKHGMWFYDAAAGALDIATQGANIG